MSSDDPGRRLENLRHRTLRELEYQRSQGRLREDEYGRRSSLARDADSAHELRPLIADLVVGSRSGGADALGPSGRPAADLGDLRVSPRSTFPTIHGASSTPTIARHTAVARGDGREAEQVLAIMSSSVRVGDWHPPATVNAVSIMGGVKLDFREVTFSAETTTVHAWAVMGGITILVPPDVDLVVTGVGFMGGFADARTPRPAPGAPRLHIDGLALMGGVDVKVRHPDDPADDD